MRRLSRLNIRNFGADISFCVAIWVHIVEEIKQIGEGYLTQSEITHRDNRGDGIHKYSINTTT